MTGCAQLPSSGRGPGGVAEVQPDRCTGLWDEGTRVAERAKAGAEARLREAGAAYAASGTETPERRDAVMAKLLAARVAVSVAEAA